MIPRTLEVPCGKNGKKIYYYWDVYDTKEEAIYYAKKVKMERKVEMCLKYYIIESQDSWFLPVTKFAVYLNKKLKIF